MNISQLETPCYILNAEKFKEYICEFHTAIKECYSNGILGYSVKTNSLPYVLKIVKDMGGYAEVVSYDEYALAREVGFVPQRMIYNGPLKNKETFLEAVTAGAYVNIENFREIEWLDEVDRALEANIGIRINVNLTTISPEDAKEDDEYSRFGFCYENGDVKAVITAIEEKGFKIKGLHLHRTSKTRSLDVYANICKYANRILEEFDLHLDYFDIGGGFYGGVPGKPSYRDYIQCIHNHLNIDNTVKLIVEPGAALIAPVMEYMTTILDTKMINNVKVCTSDGSRIDIDPLFHKTNYLYSILTDEDGEDIGDIKQVIVGCTCLEFDKLFEVKETIKAGDKLQFYKVGAYTMTLTPNFIRLLPNVYVFEDGDYKCIREKWSYKEWIQKADIGK